MNKFTVLKFYGFCWELGYIAYIFTKINKHPCAIAIPLDVLKLVNKRFAF